MFFCLYSFSNMSVKHKNSFTKKPSTKFKTSPVNAILMMFSVFTSIYSESCWITFMPSMALTGGVESVVAVFVVDNPASLVLKRWNQKAHKIDLLESQFIKRTNKALYVLIGTFKWSERFAERESCEFSSLVLFFVHYIESLISFFFLVAD